MKKMKSRVALLVSILLVGTPVGTVRADEVTGTADVNGQIEIQENEAQENETQENQTQENEIQENEAQENETQESGAQENEAQESGAQEGEAQEIQTQTAVGESAQVSTLVFGTTNVVQNSTVVTPSGDGWNYDNSTNTLHITKDVTIGGSAEKIIEATGDLHITVENGVTLTVESINGENTRYVIYASGNIALDGKGTIDITHEDQRNGIRAQEGITIQGITLNLLSGGSFSEIRANGGELVIKDAVVTSNGLCMAWNDGSSYYPVRILGQSVVNIVSTNSSGGLRGAEFEFSDRAHVKVQSKSKIIGGSNLAFNLVAGQTEDYYFRATDGTSFTKGKIEITTNRDTYFEYIGADHVNKDTIKQNTDQKTHTMECECGVSITASCYGGTATCTTQAVCEVCRKGHGDLLDHTYNEYHVCSKCGELYASDNPYDSNKVVVAVVSGSEKRGYTSGEMKAAIDFAGTHRDAVFTIIDPKRECLDGLQVNNPNADFTIDLDGINNEAYGSVTVSSGKVTIRDSKTGGTFHVITTEGTGTVTLKSGKIMGGVDVTNGMFNVNGGTIPYINLTDGQLNWNSSAAEVKNINYKGRGKMTINAVPKSTIPISLPIKQDLSQPVVVLGNGISLTENMLAIDIGRNSYYMTPYTLKPVIQGNQIYARLPLTQLETDDIVLAPSSGFTYDGKAKKLSVTVQRYKSKDDGTIYKDYLTEETDYTVTYKDNVNAGTATVTITGIGCYTDTVERTFTIAKAAPEKSVVDADSRTYSCRVDNADRVDLTAYLPKDHGAIIAAATTADGDLTYSSAPSVAGGVLSYTIKSSEAAGGMINVTVSTTNYEDITIRIPVETKDIGILKLMDGSVVTLQNATLTEGEKLSTLKFNDAVFVDEEGNEVTGTLVFRTPDAAPAVGTVDAEWVFQPDNGKTYMEISGMVSIMVKAKATSGGGSSSGGSSSGGVSSGGGGVGGGGAAVTDPKNDTKKDDTKKDDTKKDNTKKDDTKKDNTKKDDSKKDNTKKDDTKTDDTKTDSTKQDTATPEPAGTKLKDSSGVSYEVTSDSKKAPTVTYTEAPKKAKETVTIPKTVTVDGTKYKVTSIEENAFAENKNVKQIVVSQNITTIGANAFADCSKLKTITINSVKLTGKNVADDAFADIADGTVIRVPQKMLDRYQRLFEKKGLSKKVKVVAIKNRKNK